MPLLLPEVFGQFHLAGFLDSIRQDPVVAVPVVDALGQLDCRRGPEGRNGIRPEGVADNMAEKFGLGLSFLSPAWESIDRTGMAGINRRS